MPQTRTTQLWTSPVRATSGHVRRILIVALATLMVVAAAAIAPNARADAAPVNTNDPDYWETQTTHESWCFKHEVGAQTAHGAITDDGYTVTLNPFNPSWWGDHWELLVVKAGSGDGSNLVTDHPSAGVAYPAPDDKEVSHWIVCKGENPPPTELKLVKEVSGSDDSPDLWDLTATDGDQGKFTDQGGSGTFHDVDPNVGYALSESGPTEGYAAGDWNCTTGGALEGSTVTLTEGSSVTCTITNTYTPPEEPTELKLVKEVSGSDDSPDLWDLTATDGDQGKFTDQGGSGTFHDVDPNVGYALSESGPTEGYAAGDWNCTTGGALEGSTVTLTEGSSVTCTITNTYTPPEEPEYKITFVKQVCEDYSDIWKNPNGDNLEENAEELTGGDVTWSEVTPGAEKMGDCKPAAGWSFRIGSEKVSGGSPGNLSYVTGEYRTVTTGSDGRVTATLTEGEAALALKGTGNLWISEEAQSGFGFGAIRCGNDILNGDNLEWVAFDAGPSAPLTEATVVQGGHKFCYAYNVAPEEPEDASLKLVKVVSGGTAGPDDWRLYAATSVEGKTDRNFDNLGDEGVFEDVYAGVAYKLSESSGPARYTASSWSCVIGGEDQISEAAADPIILSNGMITLEPLEEATCTITNRYRPPTDPDTPRIDIEKATNGVDADTPALGPELAVGSPVTWTYVVTNTGNVPLTNVKVVDDKLGAITCPKTSLIILEKMTCTASGVADLVQYANVGTVTGSYGSTIVTDKDPSHYKGAASLVGGTAQLGDTVWLDVNKNGVQDSGEVGYNGADVILKDADGNVVGTLTTATGPWVGFYSFVGLDAGTYTAMLDLSTIGTYKVSTATAFTVTLAEGDEYLDADFGLYEDAAPPTTTVPPEETLPTTGAETAALAVLAAAMLILGALAVLATRRRRIEDQ